MASTTEKESSLTHWDNFGGNPSTAHIAFCVERDSGIKTWEPQPQPFASQTSIESETSLWESEAFMSLKYFFRADVAENQDGFVRTLSAWLDVLP